MGRAKIAFIGCGNMGEALLKGVLSKGVLKNRNIIASDVRPARIRHIGNIYRVHTTLSNYEAVRRSAVIILAVKPQNMRELLAQLSSTLKNKLIISIAAGIKTDSIRTATGARRIIRVMPNVPALIGCGISAISAAQGAKTSDIAAAKRIFSCVGKVIRLKEKDMDAVTALSGSGPAYFFLMMEALIKAAGSLGIREDIAKALVVETAYGTGCLQRALRADPSVLRQKVTSKGGTTEAAVRVFEKKGFSKIVAAAVKEAAKRSKRLSK